MMDEVSLREFTSGSLAIVKNTRTRCCKSIFRVKIKSREIKLFSLDHDRSYLEKYKRGKKTVGYFRACKYQCSCLITKSRMRNRN
jgi:hypothetical protein